MQGTLEAIYTHINPSVVNIQVTSTTSAGQSQSSPSGSQVQRALGSGFVWDANGYIVTNNHVVDGATNVTVTFSDGRVLTAKVVGQDPDADLAVIKVDNAGQITPLQMTNSDQVKVGEMAVAIGNPFGLSGTMTVGFVSALGRTLNANEAQTSNTPAYTIPDVIQTDAAINPGNSGGVLLNDQGQVIGVTSAIESSNGSSAGIGFVIPANIVSQVVPELIKNGKFEHPYLGISGTDMTPQLAKAMNLSSSQRGALVASVASGGPADKAGLKGSTQAVTIDGLNAHVKE
jgi:2-alkenal reductase